MAPVDEDRIRPQPRYDIFTRTGDCHGAAALDFIPSAYLPLKLTNGKLYALVPDCMDVPYVVRATVSY